MQYAICQRLKLPALGIAALFLSACAPDRVDPVVVVPPLEAWPVEEQEEVADELEACEDCDALIRVVGAYISLRDAIRAAGN
jgi:hypothetical protein